jgi:DNA-binding PucR family transcriptional regulator
VTGSSSAVSSAAPHADWHALVAPVVRDATAGIESLTSEINAAITAGVPSLGRDGDVRQEVDRSTYANLEAILALFADPRLPVDRSAPTEALSLVGTLLRGGIDPQDLIQAYRIGQNTFWRWWMQRLTREIEPGPELIDALERSSALLFARIDFLVAEVLRRWDAERDRWAGGALARRADIVQRLLAREPLSLADAARELGYDLDRVMTAAILWDFRPAGDYRGPALEEVAAALTTAAGGDAPLTLPMGAATLWVWIGTAETPDIAALAATARAVGGDGIGVGLGTPSPRGFRASHIEAAYARQIAELAGRGTGVVSYAEVEIVSLLGGDLERLDPFVRRAAGGLCASGDAPGRLRDTVRTWLVEGRNARAAADRLGLHKNTVLYRLQRAELMRGRPLSEDRLELELALTVLATLGTETFPDAPDLVRADA